MHKGRKELGLGLLLLVLCIGVSIANPHFYSPFNLQNTTQLIGIFGIIGMGAAVVIVTGGIDLSIGSACAFLGVLLSIGVNDKQWSPFLVIPAIIALGALLGGINALLITKAKLQPFIVTLCGLLIYRGVARVSAGDETKGFGNAHSFAPIKSIINGQLLGVPFALLLFLFLAAIMAVVLHRSVYGRHLYAVGKNEEAARYAGIQTGRVTAAAYIIGGLMTGIASILIACYTNDVSPASHAESYELYAIAAAVLGGFSLRGGEGSIVGVLLGTALLEVLQNVVNLLGIPSSLNFAVMGSVILIGTLIDSFFSSRKRVKKTG